MLIRCATIWLVSAISSPHFTSTDLPKIQDQKEKAFDFCARGNELLFAGDYQGALREFGKAIDVAPTYSPAYYYRGTAKRAVRDYNGALADYTKALSLKPDDAGYHFSRGELHHAFRHYDSAIKDFTKAVELSPKMAGAFHFRGLAKQAKKDHVGAIKDFTECIKMRPKAIEAYTFRARSRQATGDAEGAKRDIATAEKLKPQSATAQAAFKKLEDILVSARIASVSFELSGRSSKGRKDDAGDYSGSLALKKDNHYRVYLKDTTNPQKTILLVSNGTTTGGMKGGLVAQEKETPRGIREALAIAFIRGGVLSAVGGFVNGFKEGDDVRAMIKISEIEHGENDGELKALIYKFRVGGRGPTYKTTLWYEGETHKIIRRTTVLGDGDQKVTWMETYQRVSFNTELPNETFTLPTGK